MEAPESTTKEHEYTYEEYAKGNWPLEIGVLFSKQRTDLESEARQIPDRHAVPQITTEGTSCSGAGVRGQRPAADRVADGDWPLSAGYVRFVRRPAEEMPDDLSSDEGGTDGVGEGAGGQGGQAAAASASPEPGPGGPGDHDQNQTTGNVGVRMLHFREPRRRGVAWARLNIKKLLLSILVPAFNTLVGLVLGLCYFAINLYADHTGTGHVRPTPNTDIKLFDSSDGSIMDYNDEKPKAMDKFVEIGDPVVAIDLAVGASIGAFLSALTMRNRSPPQSLKLSCYAITLGMVLQLFVGNNWAQTMHRIVCGSALGYGHVASIVWIVENMEEGIRHLVFSTIPFFATLGFATTFYAPLAFLLLLIFLILFSFSGKLEGRTSDETGHAFAEQQIISWGLEAISRVGRRRTDYDDGQDICLPVVLKPFRRRSFYRPMVVIIALLVLQQFSGSVASFSLAFKFREEYSCPMGPTALSAVLTFFCVAASVVFFFLLNQMQHRRKTFLACQLFMTLAVAGAVLVYLIFELFEKDPLPQAVWCAPSVLAGCVGAVAMAGALPIPLLACAELFDRSCRAAGMGVGVAAACAAMALVLTLAAHPPFYALVGHNPELCLMPLACMACLYVADSFLPETKDMTESHLRIYFFKGWCYRDERHQ